jgi:hypothetical protein
VDGLHGVMRFRFLTIFVFGGKYCIEVTLKEG